MNSVSARRELIDCVLECTSQSHLTVTYRYPYWEIQSSMRGGDAAFEGWLRQVWRFKQLQGVNL